MKKYSILAFIILIASCQPNLPKKEIFTLSGTLTGDYSDYIYLNYGKIKDSVKVNNNKFNFTGSVDKPILGRLTLKPPSNVPSIYIENSNITLKTDFKITEQNKQLINFLKISELKGSKSAIIRERYKNFYQENKTKENFSTLLFNELKGLFNENPKHPFAGTVLGELALIEPVLKHEQVYELYSIIDTTTQNKGDLYMIKRGLDNLNKFGVGKSFPKLILPNINSKQINIKSYLGKITLVDFWASWCMPCRQKHPELIKLKKKYASVDFEILSVSQDEDLEDWTKAIKRDSLNWENVIDSDKRMSIELGIHSLPFNYLINEEGIVLGINLSIEGIELILKDKLITNKTQI